MGGGRFFLQVIQVTERVLGAFQTRPLVLEFVNKAPEAAVVVLMCGEHPQKGLGVLVLKLIPEPRPIHIRTAGKDRFFRL